MTAPLSDTQLAEIRARKAAASGGGRWILLAGRTADEYRVKAIVGEDEVVVGSLEFGAGPAARDDKSFVVNAGRDIAVLLAEVDRLRAVVADHEGEVVRYDADHERLSAELASVRTKTLQEAMDSFHKLAMLAPDSRRAPGLNFAIGALMALRDHPATPSV